MIDQLKSLAVFAKVAEVGSFSGAAKALGITAPVVSQHVSQLEKDLEQALVYRSTRSLRLTENGKSLAIAAQKMLEAAGTGIENITDDTAPPHGKLFVAAPGISDYGPFIDGVAKYVRDFPGVELSISFDDKVRDLIRDGFDIALRGSMAMDDSGLISKKLIEFPLLLTCAPAYIAEKGPVNAPSDLAEHGYEWIGGGPMDNGFSIRRKDNPAIRENVSLRTSVRVDTHKARTSLAVRGLGLASQSLPDMKDEKSSGQLVEPLPEWEFDPIGFYAVWPANAGARSLTRHFLNFLLSEMATRKIA